MAMPPDPRLELLPSIVHPTNVERPVDRPAVPTIVARLGWLGPAVVEPAAVQTTTLACAACSNLGVPPGANVFQRSPAETDSSMPGVPRAPIEAARRLTEVIREPRLLRQQPEASHPMRGLLCTHCTAPPT